MDNSSYPPPPAQNGPGKKVILIVVGVLALCCVCAALTGGVGAAYYYLLRPTAQSQFIPPPTEEAIPVLEDTLPAEEPPLVEGTPVPEEPVVEEATETPVAAESPAATETPAANSNPNAIKGLGVTRKQMMDFYGSEGAFKFDAPTTAQGIPYVMGTHTWLCVGTNCAAVTLAGPEDNLQAIAIVVPTKPDDTTQTTICTLLLMTTAARFTDDAADNVVPGQVMDEVLNAQKNSQTIEKAIESSGYVFTVSYDAKTHNAGLLVARPKK